MNDNGQRAETTIQNKTIPCNCLILGMGNVSVDVIADSYNEVLMRLHSEDDNDRFVDGFHAGLPIRIYRTGLAGIGPKSPIVVPKPTILGMGGRH